MKTVNALYMRHKLGEVFDYLAEAGEPVLISKGKEIKAALVTIEDFNRRFVDKLAEEKKQEMLERIHSHAARRIGDKDSAEVLRHLREGDL